MKKLIMILVVTLMLCISSFAEEYKTIYLPTKAGNYALKIPSDMVDFTTLQNKNITGLIPPNLCVLDHYDTNTEIYSLFVVCDRIEIIGLAKLTPNIDTYWVYKDNIPVTATKDAFIKVLEIFVSGEGV